MVVLTLRVRNGFACGASSATVVALSSGKVPFNDWGTFERGLHQVCRDLAEDVVRNGEGVRHVLISHYDDPIPKFGTNILLRRPWWLGPPEQRPPGVPKSSTWRPGGSSCGTGTASTSCSPMTAPSPGCAACSSPTTPPPGVRRELSAVAEAGTPAPRAAAAWPRPPLWRRPRPSRS